MILAISRFRVTNGLEAQVTAAFLDRPHLVDSAPGFLGMETFTAADDHAVLPGHTVDRSAGLPGLASQPGPPPIAQRYPERSQA